MCSGQRRDLILKEQSTNVFVERGPGLRWTFPDKMRSAEITKLDCSDWGKNRLYKRWESGKEER